MRDGVGAEMNPYCRRAVAQGVTLARDTGGSCTVLTLGPESAEDVLREAVAWGADSAVHICDRAFSGSDTLATAEALAAALRRDGPYDLVLLGLNSIDGETGQVGPEVAELLDLPFASGVREMEDLGGHLRLRLEHDDGTQEVEIALPAVLAVAERLCDPCKVDPAGRAAVDPARIRRVVASDLGEGPWGDAASPTAVGATRTIEHQRALMVTEGPVADQVALAVGELVRRGALGSGSTSEESPGDRDEASHATDPAGATRGSGRIVAVLAEPGRPEVGRELLGAAAALADEIDGAVHALCPGDAGLVSEGADVVVVLDGSVVAEDVADAVSSYVRDVAPWAVLAPSTAFGREVAGRAAAATGSGLVGDAIGLSIGGGVLIAAKPAFAGALVADITCRSPVQMVTVRPGVLPARPLRRGTGEIVTHPVSTRHRVRVLGEQRNDDVETLARAPVVIGVGQGVAPDQYELLSPLASLLGAELAATRKVTDKGWAPARPAGGDHRALRVPSPVHRNRPEREVQPSRRRARRRNDRGDQHRPGGPRLRSLRHRYRGGLARGGTPAPAGAASGHGRRASRVGRGAGELTAPGLLRC